MDLRLARLVLSPPEATCFRLYDALYRSLLTATIRCFVKMRSLALLQGSRYKEVHIYSSRLPLTIHTLAFPTFSFLPSASIIDRAILQHFKSPASTMVNHSFLLGALAATVTGVVAQDNVRFGNAFSLGATTSYLSLIHI